LKRGRPVPDLLDQDGTGAAHAADFDVGLAETHAEHTQKVGQ
jgi:hypothetical protein